MDLDREGGWKKDLGVRVLFCVCVRRGFFFIHFFITYMYMYIYIYIYIYIYAFACICLQTCVPMDICGFYICMYIFRHCV